MAKFSKSDLCDVGLTVLGTTGAKGFGIRAVEDAANVPHGTLRHHFGGYEGFVTAIVERLLESDLPAPGETPAETITRWLGPQRDVTRARFELALLATRDPALATRFTATREGLVSLMASALGVPQADAHELLVSLDGLILDALLRDAATVDPAPLLARYGLT